MTMTKRRDSLTDYQRWQEDVWKEMKDRAERAKNLDLLAEVQAVEADPPDKILRHRLRAVGASDEDILYFRLVLRQHTVTEGKTAEEARRVADDTLREYLNKGVLDSTLFES
jgi:hypothetical protein